jgi:hypothetical protein
MQRLLQLLRLQMGTVAGPVWCLTHQQHWHQLSLPLLLQFLVLVLELRAVVALLSTRQSPACTHMVSNSSRGKGCSMYQGQI